MLLETIVKLQKVVEKELINWTPRVNINQTSSVIMGRIGKE